jgi:hypothetical protein
MNGTIEVSSRYLPCRGPSDGLVTAGVEVSSRYLPHTGPSDGLVTAAVEVSSRSCHVGVLAMAL